MAKITVTLQDGLTVGDKKHTATEIREYTAGDLLDACDAAEKLVYQADGTPVLVTSPARVDLELLCRQVMRIGDVPGPLDIAEIRKLSGTDLAILQGAAKALDIGGAPQAITLRGRSDGSQGSV